MENDDYELFDEDLEDYEEILFSEEDSLELSEDPEFEMEYSETLSSMAVTLEDQTTLLQNLFSVSVASNVFIVLIFGFIIGSTLLKKIWN